MGTPEFGAIILEGLCQFAEAGASSHASAKASASEYKPILVVTAQDKPVGRKQIITPPPVKVIAQKYNIPIFQPSNLNNSSYVYLLRQKRPDLIVVAAYGQILPKEILDIPKHGCLNVHPSLLPKYRGPSPIQYAILSGEKKTGVTIMLMDEKMDHGDTVANSKFEIRPQPIFNGLGRPALIQGLRRNLKITSGELSKDLADLGSKLLIETIPKWIKGEIKPKPQDHSKATYTKILRKEDGKIDWKKSAEEIERQIRAFDPWPGSYTFWERERIKILKSRILEKIGTLTYSVGKTLVAPQNELCIQTGEGFLIIEKLQMEGKKEMASEEFLRGHLDFIGTILK